MPSVVGQITKGAVFDGIVAIADIAPTGLTASQLLRANAGLTAIESAGVTVADLAAAAHNHAATDITSAQLALARGGTAADLSAANANKLVKQNAATNAMEYATVTEAAGVLGAVAGISGAAAIAFKPSGSTLYYLNFIITGTYPSTSIVGGPYWLVESDNAANVSMVMWKNISHFLSLGYDKTNDRGNIYCKDAIDVQPKANTGQYLRMQTLSGVPEITTIGACNLKLSADAGGVVQLDTARLPNGAGGTSVTAGGDVCVDTTSRTLNFHDGTAEVVLNPVQSKSITIESPTNAEDLTLFFTEKAITITKIVAILTGSGGQSVTWTVRHGTDRSAAGAEVVTGGSTTTSITTAAVGGATVTSFNDATVTADSFLWLETTATAGTVATMNLTIFYRQDP